MLGALASDSIIQIDYVRGRVLVPLGRELAVAVLAFPARHAGARRSWRSSGSAAPSPARSPSPPAVAAPTALAGLSAVRRRRDLERG